jgi:hypothetical protein
VGNVIYKYGLDHLRGQQTYWLPRGARVVHVGCQLSNPTPFIWIQHETPGQVAQDLYTFRVVATGEVFEPDEHQHIGTVVMPSGLVWHVFLTKQKS